jgi:signal transduction histidine kinase
VSGKGLRPPLWTVFAALAAATLVLTLLGLGLVRVYDNQLVRQTESELIAQGVVLASAFRDASARDGALPPCVAPSLPWPFPRPNDKLRPILPTLNASSKIEPPPHDPPASSSYPDPSMRRVGAEFTPLLLETARATLASLRIVDTEGTVISTSAIGMGTNLAGHAEVQQALKGAPSSALRTRLGEPPDSALASLSRNTGVRVFVALPITKDDCVIGAIVLARTPMTWAKATYADRWNLAGSGSVLLAVLALASLASSTLVVRPIRRLVAKANAIRGGASPQSVKAASPAISELFALSESLDAMAGALAEKNDALRAFAASVSHEFKTPLASIRGAVELLEDDAMAPEQRARFLKNVSNDADRLTRLVQRLLELTRAESSAQRGACDALQTATEAAGQDTRISVRGPAAKTAMPKEALLAVLGHLIENAFQHGGKNVALTLGGGQLIVTDDGPGISEANRAKVFDTFFTTARESGGTGMGLSIARALMRAFGGELTLEPPSTGATFRLTLPPPG